jgi:hypothetical protein
MSITGRQQRDFADEIAGHVTVDKSGLLAAIEFIKSNFEPDDIFDEKDLVDYVAKSKTPEDVFPEKELAEWAESNGYVKE